METAQRNYLPAAGHDLFLPLYDPMVKLFGGDAVRKRLIELATLRSGERILEVGCGTGALLLLMKRTDPGLNVVGLDPDPKALALAERKSVKAGVEIQFDQGFSDELPYPDAGFDRVFSSFMFHHLKESEKKGTLLDVRRVLKPGGSLYLLDFAGPDGRDRGWTHWIHSSHRLKDNAEEKICALFREAGFQNLTTVHQRTRFLGQMVYYAAHKARD